MAACAGQDTSPGPARNLPKCGQRGPLVPGRAPAMFDGICDKSKRYAPRLEQRGQNGGAPVIGSWYVGFQARHPAALAASIG